MCGTFSCIFSILTVCLCDSGHCSHFLDEETEAQGIHCYVFAAIYFAKTEFGLEAPSPLCNTELPLIVGEFLLL